MRIAIDTNDTPPDPSSHMVLTFTSATSSPVVTMYIQHSTHVRDDARNPASCVTAGIARIPAPTVVPAIKRIALLRLPGSCWKVASFTFEKSLS